ncbi:MAG: site-specific DNA-methyltransferase [Clostridia bacterium]|nr:site-specific DNA-methyltransferase [Clostridia bacterium]
MFERIPAEKQKYGNGESLLICGNVMNVPQEIKALYGTVQCVYVDPPFRTGEKFKRKRPYGTKGWKTGTPAPSYDAYNDRYTDEKAYLRLLRKLIHVSRELLKNDGIFYLHLDWRMSAQARQLCDREFGKTRFLNEIIWSYESGGRTKKYFSRKHDVILMYACSANYKFDITKVPLDRTEVRRNHMGRGMDEDGRMYGYIRSGGKEYRYYDDEPVYPGDVWSDIGFLQQRDPERTGYATQKPLKLLERLLKPVTEPGDLVADLCCGSGTTAAAAQALGCRFAAMDLSPEAIAVTKARLKPDNMTVICPETKDRAELLCGYDNDSGRLRVYGITAENKAFPAKHTPEDSLESWEMGHMEEGVFTAEQTFRRSHRYPELTLDVKIAEKDIDTVLTTDAAGAVRTFRYVPESKEI